jgi:hypothetical protein
MPITEPYELDGVTIGTSEVSIVSGTTSLQTITDDGFYQLWLDPVGAAVVKGDDFLVRVYEKVRSGSTKRVVFRAHIQHAQSEPWVFPPLPLMHGWDMTIQKIAGTDRAFDASIRAVTGAGLTEFDGIDAVTVGVSEVSIPSGTTSLSTLTDAGIYTLMVDGATLARADSYRVRVYEKVEASGGTKRKVFEATLEGVQGEVFATPQLLLKNGWDMTLQKVAGADCAFDASIRRVA